MVNKRLFIYLLSIIINTRIIYRRYSGYQILHKLVILFICVSGETMFILLHIKTMSMSQKQIIIPYAWHLLMNKTVKKSTQYIFVFLIIIYFKVFQVSLAKNAVKYVILSLIHGTWKTVIISVFLNTKS